MFHFDLHMSEHFAVVTLPVYRYSDLCHLGGVDSRLIIDSSKYQRVTHLMFGLGESRL